MKLLVLLVGLVGVVIFFAACEEGHDLTVENRTDRVVIFFQDGGKYPPLSPGESGNFAVFEFRGTRTFVARDEAGVALYSELLTYDDLKRIGWKIAVTGSRTPSPAPARQ